MGNESIVDTTILLLGQMRQMIKQFGPVAGKGKLAGLS
jgi:hypothetical protein